MWELYHPCVESPLCLFRVTTSTHLAYDQNQYTHLWFLTEGKKKAVLCCCSLHWHCRCAFEQCWTSPVSFQNKWLSRSPMLQRRVYHSMAAVQRKLYVLGGNDLDYNNDRILVRHIDSYSIDADQWTRCSFNMLTGEHCTKGELKHLFPLDAFSLWNCMTLRQVLPI